MDEGITLDEFVVRIFLISGLRKYKRKNYFSENQIMFLVLDM